VGEITLLLKIVINGHTKFSFMTLKFAKTMLITSKPILKSPFNLNASFTNEDVSKRIREKHASSVPGLKPPSWKKIEIPFDFGLQLSLFVLNFRQFSVFRFRFGLQLRNLKVESHELVELKEGNEFKSL
jgi:hypothetical protein